VTSPYIADIRQAIVAGIVLSIETARTSGPVNLDFMAGVVALAKHQALTFGIPWSFVINDAQIALGDNLDGLLEASYD
jgi:hypothetical protein